MKRPIAFDIETIPQEDLSRAQQEHLEKRIESHDDDEEVDIDKIKSTDPFLGKIVCIGFAYYGQGNEVVTESLTGEEDFILQRFWHDLSEFGSNVTYVSFNGLRFDVPFIKIRSLKNRINPSKKRFLNTKSYQKFPHYDVFQWISDWSYRRRVSLDLTCDLLDVPTPKEGAIKAEDVYQAYQNGRIKEIAEYCERDCEATLQVYSKMMN